MKHPENPFLAAVKSKDGEHYLFWCPGCLTHHGLYPDTMTGNGPRWKVHSFNPLTVTPSLLVRWDYAGEDKRCHFFIKNNQLQFLSDCTHNLAGKTVDMVEGA